MSARDDLTKVIYTSHRGNTQVDLLDNRRLQGSQLAWARLAADTLIAAGWRKAEPAWAETLANDGSYEYTVSSDCDGSNVKHWRRRPGLTYEGQATPWESYEPGAAK